jgi:hypothetical protein
MPLSEVAALMHLGWDTVKAFDKANMRARYAHIPLHEVIFPRESGRCERSDLWG